LRLVAQLGCACVSAPARLVDLGINVGLILLGRLDDLALGLLDLALQFREVAA
jgi:hypothetical protein